MAERIRPHVVVRRNVVCQSSRQGAPIKLLVVHDTESHNRQGISDLVAIADLFDTWSTQASAHVCTDAEGQSARFVRDENKAWHVAAYNRWALGVEQIGFAQIGDYTDAEYRETARWLARWSAMHKVPLHKGGVENGDVTTPGVVRHSELGYLGGGHSDPGVHYDLHRCLFYARRYRTLLVG